MFKRFIGQILVIRTKDSGVHYGKVLDISDNGKEVLLENSSRIYYWSGAASLSQLAVEGVKNPDLCKFCVEIPVHGLPDAIEHIPVSEKSLLILNSVKKWKI